MLSQVLSRNERKNSFFLQNVVNGCDSSQIPFTLILKEFVSILFPPLPHGLTRIPTPRDSSLASYSYSYHPFPSTVNCSFSPLSLILSKLNLYTTSSLDISFTIHCPPKPPRVKNEVEIGWTFQDDRFGRNNKQENKLYEKLIFIFYSFFPPLQIGFSLKTHLKNEIEDYYEQMKNDLKNYGSLTGR